MPEIRSPASIVDVAELSGATSHLQWAVMREMHAGGLTWTLWHADELLGLFGVYPVEPGLLGEAWFNIRREAAPHMLFLTRQIRLTLSAELYPAFVTVVGTRAGARIARACGFEFRERQLLGDLYGRIVRE